MTMEKQTENKKNEEANVLKDSFSSIELKQTTRGIGLKVKIYSSDTDEEVDRIVHKAQRVFDGLRNAYETQGEP